MPHVCADADWYRSDLNGMRTSTSKPHAVTRPFDWNTKSGLRSALSRDCVAPMKLEFDVCPTSFSTPSACTPSGFTMNTIAWRPSLNVSSRSCT